MATEFFAKIGDIKGESQDDKHKDEIEIVRWSWGMSHDSSPLAGGGGASGKARFADFVFTHAFDKASPVLMKACVTGEHLKAVTITGRKAGQGPQDYLVVILSDVIITSVTPSGSPEDSGTAETVSLQYAKVDVDYKAQKPDGSLDAGTRFKYDLKTNKEG